MQEQYQYQYQQQPSQQPPVYPPVQVAPPSPDNLFYSFFYSFVNPKTWTFNGPWGTCATRTEYWYYFLAFCLYSLSYLTIIGPVIFVIFAFVNRLHKGIPSTSNSGTLTVIFWILYILSGVLLLMAWIPGLNILYFVISFLCGIYLIVGQCYLVCRRAHDIGMSGLWWNVARIGGGFIVAFIFGIIGGASGSGEVVIAGSVLGLIVPGVVTIILGLIPSKTAAEGNPYAMPLSPYAGPSPWQQPAQPQGQAPWEQPAQPQGQTPWQQPAQPQGQAPWEQPAQPQGQAPWQQPAQPQGQAPWQQPAQPQGQAPWQQPAQPQGQAPWQQPAQPQGQAPWQQPAQPQGQAPLEQSAQPQGQAPLEQPVKPQVGSSESVAENGQSGSVTTPPQEGRSS